MDCAGEGGDKIITTNQPTAETLNDVENTNGNKSPQDSHDLIEINEQDELPSLNESTEHGIREPQVISSGSELSTGSELNPEHEFEGKIFLHFLNINELRK